MTTADTLVERPPTEKPFSPDQLAFIKRMTAPNAPDDEFRLYLYDCQRRGVHPLDKLLYFTRHGGKYTPVTSIDFLRSRAASSGELAGIDDAVFTEANGKLVSATVTVYRLTQGVRYAYTATARWAEYAVNHSPIWPRMPHVMLGKCAEALALRKAFAEQLGGLYVAEEMQQADNRLTAKPDEKPTSKRTSKRVTKPADEKPAEVVDETTGEIAEQLGADQYYVRHVRELRRGQKNGQDYTLFAVEVSTGQTFQTFDAILADTASDALAEHRAVEIISEKTDKGANKIVSLQLLGAELVF